MREPTPNAPKPDAPKPNVPMLKSPVAKSPMPAWAFVLCCALGAGIVFAGVRQVGNDYVFFAGYTVLQFIVLYRTPAHPCAAPE